MKKKICAVVTVIIIAIFIIVVILVNNSKTEEKQNNMPSNYVANNETLYENEKGYKVSCYITEEMRQNAKTCTPVVICYGEGFTPEYLYKNCDSIAIIRVISLDKVDFTKNSSFGVTYGKAIINNNLYGNFKDCDVISFSKIGGIASTEQIQKESGENFDFEDDEYLNMIREYDIEIEEGKTYLAYLKYNEEDSCYEIIGLGYGLRELNVPKEAEYIESVELDFNNVEIIKQDNVEEYNGIEYTSLQDYVDKYINEYKK